VNSKHPLVVRRLGVIRYAEALDLQARLVGERQQDQIPDTLLLLEHTPVITLGRNARRENLLLPIDALRARGIEVFDAGRGGDVTYHGPGQAVAYPILNLAPDRCDVHRYVRDLEEVMIRVAADLGLSAHRKPKLTGAWIGESKVGAIGVRIARWVTSHGLALNVSNDLSPFRLIVPCGISDKGVTSLAEESGLAPSLDMVFDGIARHLSEILDRSLTFPTDPRSSRLLP
jgi:lipoyl(octanoyl) transferase